MWTVERLEAERKVLQRRIKNQRKALREQHKTLRLYNNMIRVLVAEKNMIRYDAYRHVAVLAETGSRWRFGWQIARTIRKWL